MTDHLSQALDSAHAAHLDDGDTYKWADYVRKTERSLERASRKPQNTEHYRPIRQNPFIARIIEAAGVTESRRRPRQKLRH